MPELPAEFQQYLVGVGFSQGKEIKSLAETRVRDIEGISKSVGGKLDTLNETNMQILFQKVNEYKAAVANIGGVCQCLAVKWLKLKMKEQANKLTGSKKVDPGDRMDLLRADKRLLKACERQTAAGFDKSGQKVIGHFEPFKAVMESYKVDTLVCEGWHRNVTLKHVGDTVQNTIHGYFVVGIFCPKLDEVDKPNVEKHAIAVYTSDGGFLGAHKHAYVFDPNFGELMFPLDKFKKLFTKFVTECYGTRENGVTIFAEFKRK
jgi:hypothetical protein